MCWNRKETLPHRLAVETGNESLFLGSSGFNEVSRSTSHPNIRRAVTAWVAHFVGAGWTSRFFTKVNVEIIVDFHPAIFRIAVNLQQV